MRTIRVLFYLAERDGHLIDDLINYWTFLWNPFAPGPYSHTEIWVPDEQNGFEQEIYRGSRGIELPNPEDMPRVVYHGTAYTSTMRGDHDGTVCRPASEVLTHPSRWDYMDIELYPRDYAAMMRYMNYAVKHNKGYDKWTLLKFFLPFGRRSSKEQNICSEFVQRALKRAAVFPSVRLWSPRRLSSKLRKAGYIKESLWG